MENEQRDEALPAPDLSVVDTELLVAALKNRSRAMVVILVPASVDGEDYNHFFDHCGFGWECKGLAAHASDVLKQRFPGIYGKPVDNDPEVNSDAD